MQNSKLLIFEHKTKKVAIFSNISYFYNDSSFFWNTYTFLLNFKGACNSDSATSGKNCSLVNFKCVLDNFFNKTILQKKLPFTHLTRLTVWQLFFVRKGHLFTAVFKIAQWSKIRRKGREKRQGGLHYARQTKKGYNFKNGWNPILFWRCRNDAEIATLKVKKQT